jgi:polyhydroxybutyrate depolymerase
MKNFTWKLAATAFFLSFAADSALALTTVFRMGVGTEERSATITIPDDVLNTKVAVPVIFALHGPGKSRDNMERVTGLLKKAEEKGMITVFVNGTRRGEFKGLYWNAHPFMENDGDYSVETDEDFIQRLLRHLDKQGVVDHGKIFAVGHSMGGMMAYKLACKMSDTFAAIAVQSGAMTTEDCHLNQPVSVLHIHGVNDDRVPISGGESISGSGVIWPNTRAKIEEWGGLQSCGVQSFSMAEGQAYCTMSTCDAGTRVSMCFVYDAGHDWMGKMKSRAHISLYDAEEEFKSTDWILNFFERERGREVYLAP